MEHIFLIDITEGTGYHNHALAALDEFLDLFPEHKNKFKVHIRAGNKFYEIPISELGKLSPNLQEISYSHLDNASIKISEISGNDEKSINGWIYNNSQKDSFFHYISLTKKSINNGMFYGVSSSLVLDGLDIPPENEEKYKKSSYVSVNTNRDPKQFKSILKHELGHAFKATHEERRSIDETDPAHHCTSSGCLMNNGLINGVARGDEPDFCSECIASMKKYINSLFNEQTRTNKTNVVDSSQELPPNAEINDEFKLPWRDFAKNLAQKMGWKYEEDEKRTNFKAGLKSADGSYTYINASSKNDVSLSAKDKDGNPKVPDMAVFKELVAKAQKEDDIIGFGDIKTPEFKARLLIACLEANPPVKMQNAPAISDEFLSSIDENSATTLKILKNKQENQNSQSGDDEQKPEGNQTNRILPKITSYNNTPNEDLNVLAEFLAHPDNEYGSGMDNLSIAYMNRELAIQGHCSFVDPCYVNGDTDKLRIQLVGQHNRKYLVTAPIQVYGNNNAPNEDFDNLLKNTLNMLHRYEHKFDKVFIPIGCQESGKAGHNIALILENCNGTYRATVLDQLGSSAYIDTKNKISEQLRDVGCNDIEMNQNSLTDRNRMDCATVTALLRNYTLDGTDMRNFKNQFDSNPPVKFTEKAVNDQHKKDQKLITDSCTRLADEMLKNGVIVKAGNRSLTTSKDIVHHYINQHRNNNNPGNYNRTSHYYRTI